MGMDANGRLGGHSRCHVPLRPTATDSSEVGAANTEDPDQPDDDEVDGDDKVEEPGHDQDENPGGQGNQGARLSVMLVI